MTPHVHRLTRQKREGKIRDLDIPLLVRAIAATFVGILVFRIMGDRAVEEGWIELPDLLARVLLDGLASPAEPGA